LLIFTNEGVNTNKGVNMLKPSFDVVLVGSGPVRQKLAILPGRMGYRVATDLRVQLVGGADEI
jgi:alkyl hydroperoxide reductase subunit AhpF